MGQNVSSEDTPPFHIFLSHAGEDKETIARPLWKHFDELGHSVFLDEESFRLGDHCPKVMEHAMQTAPVGVFILSPEFVAKEWPMRELLAFVRRYDHAVAANKTPPLLISVFYRFSTQECRDSTIYRTYGELFDRHGLFKRALGDVVPLKDIKHALNMAATFWSIENDLGATNSNRPNMASTRECFIQIIQNKILEVLGAERPQLVNRGHSKGGSHPEYQETYTPCVTVPSNPPKLTLEYGSSITYEGRLRAAVLRKIGSRKAPVVAIGQGGVGKTCALRGLAEDAEIKRVFSGGILYIELGNDATLPNIVESIAHIVDCTGGTNLANVIRAAGSVAGASRKALKWFGSQSCLFLIDDIWHVNGIDCDVMTSLRLMVNPCSRMVYSTRDRYFLREAEETIEFKEKNTFEKVSKQMLMTHAGFELNTVLDNKNKLAFDYFLRLCQGLPLGFGIVGSSVQGYARDCLRRQDGWSEFYNDVLSHRMNLLGTEAWTYGKLPKIVDLSLQVLKKRSGHGKFEGWFRAMSVIQKEQSVPVQMLQRLWDLDTLHEAQTVVEAFADVSVVQMTRNAGSVSVRLHDLILDVAVGKCVEECEAESFFQTLVRNYMPSDEMKKMCEAASGSRLSHAWWNDEDDGYMHNNICRILRKGGYNDQLQWLLLQPQWIVHRLLKGGVLCVEQDLNEGKAICEVPFDFGALREHLQRIGQAARLSASFVRRNPIVEEAWFQLHGRLQWCALENEWTSDFLERMESCAPRPWLKASPKLLQEADGNVLQVFSVSGTVLCTHEEKDAVWVLSREQHTDVIHVGRQEKLNEFYSEERLKVCENSREWMRKFQCASFLTDERMVVTAHGDEIRDWWMHVRHLLCRWQTGSVFVWNRQTGVCEHSIAHICPHHRRFVNFVEEGNMLACQRLDGSIQLWNTLSGEAVGKPLRTHADLKSFVSLSSHVTHVVSRLWDNSLRVWDAQHGNTVAQSLRDENHSVKYVAVSADGTRIVSGSDDSTVRVWDARTGEAMALVEPETGKVTRVAVSANGAYVVSGDTERLQLWALDDTQVELDEQVTAALRTGVCVLTSDDGTWQSTIETLQLTWCTRDWRPFQREVCHYREDGSKIVLGNCEEYVRNVGGGDVYFTRDFRSCRIVR
eukprot:TRINITY_DN13325_c0_g1_i1.p1 TRINITY_DN13325_c0_g1~~TRINITY_DN13325_c0_g1_i1.p1  ORF type:complete len:1137 (-),score=180.46 TRINITY_DN13325_c0_g1_i1:3414-6824(-)